jgi:prophage antirepressor-like protein
MSLINFEGYNIRTIEEYGEIYYSVVDIAGLLSGASNPSRYWSDLKRKLDREGSEVYDNIVSLKLEGADGKFYATDCMNREGVLRLIQSIPSSAAEPFKMWLANAGEQNIQETENPDFLIEKYYDHYRKKGQNDDWISARMRSVETRKELTERWEDAGIKSSKEYAFLTNIISEGTFELSIQEHKELKGLARKHSIRDNMSTMELVYVILAEVTAKELSERRNAHGYEENEDVAREAGKIAGDSRKRFEEKTGIKVVTPKNNLWNKLLGK